MPFLKKEAPLTDQTEANIMLIEKEELEKQKENLENEKIKINELKLQLEQREKEIQEKEKEISEQKENIEQQKKKIQEIENSRKEKQKLIDNMARRFAAMPPQNVIEIIQGWQNSDIVDVFMRMEEIAEEEGTQSIVPFLLTLLPSERSSIITSLMLDQGMREKIFQ